MQGDIIAANIAISKMGELKFFQVNLPGDVSTITGIAGDIRGYSVAPVSTGRMLAGTLKLQSELQAGICYSCQLFTGRNAIEDIIRGFTYTGGNVADLYPSPYSGGTFRGIQPVRIPGCHVLFGCFEDEIGKQTATDTSYIVSIYLYTERIK